MIFDLNLEKCVSCGACAVACMDQNDIDPSHGDTPLRRIHLLEEGKDKIRYTNLSVACMHCSDAPCVMGCPTGALYKDSATNLTLFDPDRCIGCHSCAMACPFGIPSFDQKDRITKCDGCSERLKAGLKPACVRICPFGALSVYESESQYLSQRAARSLKAITYAFLGSEEP